MVLEDVVTLVGGSHSPERDYTPIACLLKSGYGCVGYFNSVVNVNLRSSVVLLNMRLVDLRVDDGHSRRGRVADFNDFLKDVVAQHVQGDVNSEMDDRAEQQGETIPLTAIPIDEIALLYPVAHIATLLKTAQRVTHGDRSQSSGEVPSFLDFNNKSIVLKVLMTKLW